MSRRVSLSTFDSANVDLIMRDKPTQFTEEEIAALAAMNMEDPPDEVLEKFIQSSGGKEEVNTLTVISDEEEEGSFRPRPSESENLQEASEGQTNTEKFYSKRPTSSRRRPISRPGTRPGSRPGTSSRRFPVGGMEKINKEHIFSVLTKSDTVGDTDLISEAVLKVKNVDLVERSLTSTLAAETFLNATHVYLQFNQIRDLDGLQLLAHLKVLVVHHNCIESVQPLALLDELKYLDASSNAIASLQPRWDLPTHSLEYLNLKHNPCVPSNVEEYTDFALEISDTIPSLQILNDIHLNSSDDSDEEEEIEDGVPGALPPPPVVHTKAKNRLHQTLQDARENQTISMENSEVSKVQLQEKERLLQQFENRSKSKNELAKKLLLEEENTTEVKEGGDDVFLGEFLERELDEARHMHSKMYGDIMFANSVTQDRLIRSLEEQWDAVAKVVQSRHAAVTERRKRLKEKDTQSAAYKESLQLLLQEAKETDIERYRKPVE